MKKLLITLLISVGLSGITLGTFAQDSQSGAPAAGHTKPDTFTLKIQYPYPIRIIDQKTLKNITLKNNCKTDNNNCSFQLSGSAGEIAVTVGSSANPNNHCILSFYYDPSEEDKMVPSCGGDLQASGLNHMGLYQYQISLWQQSSSR